MDKKDDQTSKLDTMATKQASMPLQLLIYPFPSPSAPLSRLRPSLSREHTRIPRLSHPRCSAWCQAVMRDQMDKLGEKLRKEVAERTKATNENTRRGIQLQVGWCTSAWDSTASGVVVGSVWGTCWL